METRREACALRDREWEKAQGRRSNASVSVRGVRRNFKWEAAAAMGGEGVVVTSITHSL